MCLKNAFELLKHIDDRSFEYFCNILKIQVFNPGFWNVDKKGFE